MTSYIRRKVSQNRKRLETGEYDLDFTYITNRIIAMGLPADKLIQSFARNPLDKVAQFLNEKHFNHYKVYNLLSEQSYSYRSFNNMVASYPMQDHHAPKFDLIDSFCRDVHQWLNDHKENVAVVHCKAGKGRTGTMISCYFLFSQELETPLEAMDLFSRMRCTDSKGVTIPSQRRYVEYYADYLKNARKYIPTEIYLKQIEVFVPDGNNLSNLSFQVFRDFTTKIYDSSSVKVNPKMQKVSLLANSVRLCDDIKISFINKQYGSRKSIFHVALNTFCLLQDNRYRKCEESCFGELTIDRDEIIWCLCKKDIDVAYKDKSLSSELKLIFHFTKSNIPHYGSNGHKNEAITHSLENLENIGYNGLRNPSASIMRSDSYVEPTNVIGGETTGKLKILHTQQSHSLNELSENEQKPRENGSNASIKSDREHGKLSEENNINENYEINEENDETPDGFKTARNSTNFFQMIKKNNFLTRSLRKKTQRKPKSSDHDHLAPHLQDEHSHNYDIIPTAANKISLNTNVTCYQPFDAKENKEKRSTESLNSIENKHVKESNLKKFLLRRKPNTFKIN